MKRNAAFYEAVFIDPQSIVKQCCEIKKFCELPGNVVYSVEGLKINAILGKNIKLGLRFFRKIVYTESVTCPDRHQFGPH